jgi:hypothetical protein
MGDGPTGPVIVANLPLYVGVAEPTIRENVGTVVDPDVAEVRMLELLNEARKAAGAAPLSADSGLRQVAAGHTEDMVDHGFFGHVSPSHGTPPRSPGLGRSPSAHYASNGSAGRSLNPRCSPTSHKLTTLRRDYGTAPSAPRAVALRKERASCPGGEP